jgi:hypothetical protein
MTSLAILERIFIDFVCAVRLLFFFKVVYNSPLVN